MKTMSAILVFMQIFAVAEGADVGYDDFNSLAKEWGRGTTLDFRKKVYQVEPIVVKQSGPDVLVGWYQEIVSFPDLYKETGDTSWMHEKVEMLLTYAMMPPVNTSTNCWLAAAGLYSRYRELFQEVESNANMKIDFSLAKTDPKRFNEFLCERKRLGKKMWNLKCVETPLARVVTNVFPKGVLPALPESERSKVMTNVLVRAGLTKLDKERDPEPSDWSSCRNAKIVVMSSLVLVGCWLLMRHKLK